MEGREQDISVKHKIDIINGYKVMHLRNFQMQLIENFDLPN